MRDEMTRGETREKGRRFIGITMKLRDVGVIDGGVIVTGVTDQASHLREMRAAPYNIVDCFRLPRYNWTAGDKMRFEKNSERIGRIIINNPNMIR